MSVTVVLPRNKNRSISQIIRNKYTELWNQWRIENYPNRSYTRAKLNANIRNVLSVNGKAFNEQDFRPAAINKWRGRKVLPFAHWYFLVRFQADLFRNVYAIVEDVCYEGDYHNNTMNTKPYGESALKRINIITENINNTMKNKTVIRLTESDLHNIIAESVKQVLNELDPRTYASAARKAAERGDSRKHKYRQAAIDSWNAKFGGHSDVEMDDVLHDGSKSHHRYDAKMSDGYETYQRGIGSSWDNGKLASEYEMNARTNETNPQNIGRMSNSPFYKKALDGASAAQQMRQNNGKYIFGKGWQ